MNNLLYCLLLQVCISSSKKKSIIFPKDGFSILYLALYKYDRVTLYVVRKIGFHTKKLLKGFYDRLTQHSLSRRLQM